MPEAIGASTFLEQLFYILPRAVRKGGAIFSELSESHSVGANVVMKVLARFEAAAEPRLAVEHLKYH